MPEHAKAGEQTFKGIPVSPGVCRGRILVLDKKESSIPKYDVAEEDLPEQAQRLEKALIETRREIIEVQRQVNEGVGAENASIFDAHLLVLEDPILIDEVTRLIASRKINVEWAFHEFAEKYVATLSRIDDEYLRERVSDIRDVTERIMNNLLGRSDAGALRKLHEPCIIIAEELVPSQTALFDKKFVLGFATDSGSKTSHTAIMARSLQIPAIVGLKTASQQLKSGDYALLDGYTGHLVINPTEQTLFEYGQLARRQVTFHEKLRDILEQPAVTLDGVRVVLSANIEQPGDAAAVKNCGAEGVGLFRTEYLFINRGILPTEDEQYAAYQQVAAALKPQPVIIRTLDLGGDKFLSHLQVPNEMNPFLGWRAIRFCLQETQIFRAQLRAILRASAEGNVKMMYPMISCAAEVDQANALVEEYKTELRKEGIPFDENIEIGAMIEIPSAAIAADTLAKKVKFFSIGTNDLIQYSLAIDRLNERIAHLYEPTHPAVLRLIKMTVDAAHKHGIWCGVCGEMAGDPELIPLLLGLGVDELSATPAIVPQIKFLIRRLKLQEAKALAETALQTDSGLEILVSSQTLARNIAPSLFEK
ncbi:MAG: phosphoenolpyruvate--protein phosphotransferase [Verrucomicrobiales bacterium]|nr:phosphoenolpyruvate--protein phosphotransferase [Verrucomicrobiales bacterium]